MIGERLQGRVHADSNPFPAPLSSLQPYCPVSCPARSLTRGSVLRHTVLPKVSLLIQWAIGRGCWEFTRKGGLPNRLIR